MVNDNDIRILKNFRVSLEQMPSIFEGRLTVEEYIQLKDALTKAIKVMEEASVTWYDVKTDDMTEEQLRKAVKELREKSLKAELRITPECKYRLPCGSCDKYDKFCDFEL